MQSTLHHSYSFAFTSIAIACSTYLHQSEPIVPKVACSLSMTRFASKVVNIALNGTIGSLWCSMLYFLRKYRCADRPLDAPLAYHAKFHLDGPILAKSKNRWGISLPQFAIKCRPLAVIFCSFPSMKFFDKSPNFKGAKRAPYKSIFTGVKIAFYPCASAAAPSSNFSTCFSKKRRLESLHITATNCCLSSSVFSPK